MVLNDGMVFTGATAEMAVRSLLLLLCASILIMILEWCDTTTQPSSMSSNPEYAPSCVLFQSQI